MMRVRGMYAAVGGVYTSYPERFNPRFQSRDLRKKGKSNRFNGFIALPWHLKTVKTVEYLLVLFDHD